MARLAVITSGSLGSMGSDDSILAPEFEEFCQSAQQTFHAFINQHEAKNIGQLIEKIKQRRGVDALGLGLAGLKDVPECRMRREIVAARYTTHWDEMLTVSASLGFSDLVSRLSSSWRR